MAGILERIRRGERIDHFETVRKSKSGKLVNISLTVSPLYDDEGRVIGASKIARDITEEVRIRAELAKQQIAIRELSTPVLQVRERLQILPIIGAVESERARQITRQLLAGIRANRAKLVVIDLTGVSAVDTYVANNLVQTVDACRLMGATVIVTGVSREISQTLLTAGIDLSTMKTEGDLQSGIEEAERFLGYKLMRV